LNVHNNTLQSKNLKFKLFLFFRIFNEFESTLSEKSPVIITFIFHIVYFNFLFWMIIEHISVKNLIQHILSFELIYLKINFLITDEIMNKHILKTMNYWFHNFLKYSMNCCLTIEHWDFYNCLMIFWVTIWFHELTNNLLEYLFEFLLETKVYVIL
jgi:uncharacterized protein YbbC (DUF1343 family)